MLLRRHRRPVPPRPARGIALHPAAAAEALEGRTLLAFPNITNVSLPAAALEGRSFSVSGSFTDPDSRPEAHTIRFDWGDGTPETVQSARAGYYGFSAEHTYPDDLPGVSGPDDRRQIRITVTDALNNSATTTRNIRVDNVAPYVTLPNILVGLEGSPITLTPEVYDPGADVLTYNWHVLRGGQPVFQSSARDLVFPPPDNGQYDVSLIVTDDDGGASSPGFANLFAYNTAPTLSVSGAASADEGAPYVLSLSSADAGADTIARWTIDWGDGQVQTVAGNPPTVTHRYDGPGNYTVRATADDEDGTYGAPPLGVEYAAGDIDTTFGAGGSALIDFPRADKVGATDAAIYPDGRVLVLGAGQGHPNNDRVMLARFNPDGSLDGTFSGDGRLFEPQSQTTGSTLALQADGKIVVAGVTLTHVLVRRYLPDGSRDATFGTGGEARLALPPRVGFLDSQVNDVVALADGKVLLAGRINSTAVAIRLNADGSPDATFGGGDGVYDFPLPPAVNSTTFYAATLGPGGRVALAGNEFSANLNHSFNVAVLRPDGTLDTTFGGDGIVTTPLTSAGSTGHDGNGFAAAFQPDGKLLVGGESYRYPGPLLRYLPDGSLDNSFDGDGVAQSAWPANDTARMLALTVLPGGKILSAGYGYALALTRHNPDGTLDATFGAGGKVIFGAAGRAVAAFAAPGGKLIVAGTMQDRMMLARFTPTGAPDPTFGNNGVVTENRFVADLGGTARFVLVLPDRKILAVHPVSGAPDVLHLARFHPDGTIDLSFGDFGRVTATVPGAVRGAVLAPGGKLVVAAATSVLRFNADGTPDAGFGAGGVVTNAMGAGAAAQAVAVDSQGRIVVAGIANPSGILRVARLNPDGSPDVSFAGTGTFDGLEGVWQVFAVAPQPDGKVLVAGADGLYRFTAGGALDPTFGGGDGLASVPQHPIPPEDPRFILTRLAAIAVLTDGRILGAGGSNVGGSAGGYEVTRFLPDGSPDFSFGGGDALATAPTRGYFTDGSARQVVVDSKGRILVGGFGGDSGTITSVVTSSRYAVARLFADGAVDHSFGRDGIASVVTQGDALSEGIASMAVLDNGDVLIGGTENGASSFTRLLVSRFRGEPARELAVAVRNLAPTANAGPDRTAPAGTPLTLTGVFADAGPGETLAFRWVVAGPVGVAAEGTSSSLTFTPTFAGRYTATFTVTDDDGAAASDAAVIDVTAAVVGRHVFYNDSAFDGRSPNPNAADDAAIATGKHALLPGAGAGSFANVTGYRLGINGIMFDVAGQLPLTALAGVAGSVGLRMLVAGGAWADAPRPSQIGIRPGAGVNGSDRVTLTWADGGVKNGWLEVIVPASPAFKLARDVFAFGNLVGETVAPTLSPPKVDAADVVATRAAQSRRATVTDPADHNRDGRVNSTDVYLARNGQGRALPALELSPVSAQSQAPTRRKPPARTLLLEARATEEG